ncbi:unnamed protein product [Caenorhabditis auriculariae]|uniref:Uncharacterized protein n=1 Tax=Caenorhabditis auriculariae TaxID=2777116 RepID=A0A8S1HW83_9PELO|nr:unnamed protein product [Caenorhabditis auriculariae]
MGCLFSFLLRKRGVGNGLPDGNTQRSQPDSPIRQLEAPPVNYNLRSTEVTMEYIWNFLPPERPEDVESGLSNAARRESPTENITEPVRRKTLPKIDFSALDEARKKNEAQETPIYLHSNYGYSGGAGGTEYNFRSESDQSSQLRSRSAGGLGGVWNLRDVKLQGFHHQNRGRAWERILMDTTDRFMTIEVLEMLKEDLLLLPPPSPTSSRSRSEPDSRIYAETSKPTSNQLSPKYESERFGDPPSPVESSNMASSYSYPSYLTRPSGGSPSSMEPSGPTSTNSVKPANPSEKKFDRTYSKRSQNSLDLNPSITPPTKIQRQEPPTNYRRQASDLLSENRKLAEERKRKNEEDAAQRAMDRAKRKKELEDLERKGREIDEKSRCELAEFDEKLAREEALRKAERSFLLGGVDNTVSHQTTQMLLKKCADECKTLQLVYSQAFSKLGKYIERNSQPFLKDLQGIVSQLSSLISRLGPLLQEDSVNLILASQTPSQTSNWLEISSIVRNLELIAKRVPSTSTSPVAIGGMSRLQQLRQELARLERDYDSLLVEHEREEKAHQRQCAEELEQLYKEHQRQQPEEKLAHENLIESIKKSTKAGKAQQVFNHHISTTEMQIRSLADVINDVDLQTTIYNASFNSRSAEKEAKARRLLASITHARNYSENLRQTISNFRESCQSKKTAFPAICHNYQKALSSMRISLIELNDSMMEAEKELKDRQTAGRERNTTQADRFRETTPKNCTLTTTKLITPYEGHQILR